MANLYAAELSNPQMDAARKRAQELRALFNENVLIEMLDARIAETASMPIAKRISPERKPWIDGFSSREPNPHIRNMTEVEHARWHCAQHFRDLRERIMAVGEDFESAIMEMEATKLD